MDTGAYDSWISFDRCLSDFKEAGGFFPYYLKPLSLNLSRIISLYSSGQGPS